ncbi:MAG: hypothetical protein Q7S59_01095 [Sulfurimonas sp.]|nr:hypothetical protein [Sulfurimonas sp.]
MINKKIVCLHTAESEEDKKSIVDEITKINNYTSLLNEFWFHYEDYRATAPDTSLYKGRQDSIDREVIDTGDILIAIVHDVIEKKNLRGEIDKVLRKKGAGDTPRFLLCFKNFECNSNNEIECNKLDKIVKYKKDLKKKNPEMDFILYKHPIELCARLRDCLIIWGHKENVKMSVQQRKSETLNSVDRALEKKGK